MLRKKRKRHFQRIIYRTIHKNKNSGVITGIIYAIDALYDRIIGRTYYLIFRRDRTIKILDMQVDPDKRRQGIGTNMWLRVLQDAKEYDCRLIWLLSLESAVGFWRKLGFRHNPDKRQYGIVMEYGL